MRRLILICLFTLVTLLIPAAVHAQSAILLDAIVTDVKHTQPTKEQAAAGMSGTVVTFRIESGKLKGKLYKSDIDISRPSSGGYRAGDRVLVSYDKNPQGTEVVYIVDYERKRQLLLIFFLFLAVVFVIGRWQGLYSFIGMVFSFIIIIRMIIPNIMIGNDPVLISLLGSLFIIPVTFYLAHGINKKTTVAIVGTFISLMLTAGLAYVFIEFARLTGFAAEEAAFLQAAKGSVINIKNLLLAGIIIGALGVLDDITISQTSVVSELNNANPKYTFRQLYKSSMAIGRDHIASLVNTLVLVYTGASLPLFLLFYNTNLPYSQVVSQEIIASEIIRTLVSSIGIVAAVPITTFLACMYTKKR